MIEETLILILIVVSLRWLVHNGFHMQLLELFASIFFLLPLLLFLLLPLHFFHLLASLLFTVFLLSKSLEHILIVKESVRELILEVGIVEELRDSPLNQGHL